MATLSLALGRLWTGPVMDIHYMIYNMFIYFDNHTRFLNQVTKTCKQNRKEMYHTLFIFVIEWGEDLSFTYALEMYPKLWGLMLILILIYLG